MAKEEIVKFVLRISPELHTKLKKSAKKGNTSMNRYIETVLTVNEVKPNLDIKIIKNEVAKILQIVEGYDFS